MSYVPCPPSKPKPTDGIWRRCAHCGATGTRNRQTNYGPDREYEFVECAHCRGMGWLAAPWYYDKPVKDWPADAAAL